MIRTVLIDDEDNARTAIREMLLMMFNDVEICGEADGVYSGLKLIKEQKPDLVFLDIQMNDGNGFDLLKRLESRAFSLIFLTAYDNHALQAFRFSAIDYLLKPIDPEELQAAIQKVRTTHKTQLTEVDVLLENIQQLKGAPRKLVLKTTDSIHLVSPEKIIRCESSGNYTQFFIEEQKPILISKPLKEYEEMLLPLHFMRVHQSHLINLNHVQRIDKREGCSVYMSDQSLVPVSTRRKEHLFRLLDSMT